MLSLTHSTTRLHRSIGVLVPLVAIGIASHAQAIDIFVDSSIPQSGTGTGGFQNAKKTLQEALTLAAQDPDPNDTIRIAKGTYYVADGVPSGSIPPDPRDLSFKLPVPILPTDGVQLIGGYPPGGGPESSRNVLTNEVILSGDRDKNDPTTEAGLAAIFDQQNFGTGSPYADNVYNVVDCSGASSATVLDSVTIRGGHADGPGARGNGAGVYAPNGTPTLRSCVVEFNRVKVSTPPPPPPVFSLVDGAGGGLYATDGGALTIQYTTFRYNQALWGAGLFRGPLDEEPITAHVNLIGCRGAQPRLHQRRQRLSRNPLASGRSGGRLVKVAVEHCGWVRIGKAGHATAQMDIADWQNGDARRGHAAGRTGRVRGRWQDSLQIRCRNPAK